MNEIIGSGILDPIISVATTKIESLCLYILIFSRQVGFIFWGEKL